MSLDEIENLNRKNSKLDEIRAICQKTIDEPALNYIDDDIGDVAAQFSRKRLAMEVLNVILK